jgi:hypothetical protein
MLKHNAAGVRWEQALRQREVRTQVRQTYHEVLVLREQLILLQEADSIYTSPSPVRSSASTWAPVTCCNAPPRARNPC